MPICQGFSTSLVVSSRTARSCSQIRHSSVEGLSRVTCQITEILPALNEGEYSELIGGSTGKKVVAVWFHAQWCRKCKYIGARLRHLTEHLPSQLTDQLAVVSVDVNNVAQVPQQERIKDLPTIKFFRGGQVIDEYIANDRGDEFYSQMNHRVSSALDSML
ncbi:unnamed protein product [Choristocarpus tenellus]